jgi:hypothetical protein
MSRRLGRTLLTLCRKMALVPRDISVAKARRISILEAIETHLCGECIDVLRHEEQERIARAGR